MSRIKESTYKYLAGLIDADGTLSFCFSKTVDGMFTLGLRFAIDQAITNDPEFKVINSLYDEVGLGNLYRHKVEGKDWAEIISWHIAGKHELESFIPHVIPYMCVKAKHFKRLLEKRREMSGKRLTQEQVNILKAWAKESRLDTGPIKPKNHPSTAWVAGYIDGDGCFHCRQKKNSKYVDMHLSINTWYPDTQGVDLMLKAYGGKIYRQTNTTNTYYLSLGVSRKGTIDSFLRPLIPHLRLKKHKAEMILEKHQQRLSEKAPMGEAIVYNT